MKLNYRQQQKAIDTAIDNLVDVLNSINPAVQEKFALELGESIKMLSNWSDAQWQIREELRSIAQ